MSNILSISNGTGISFDDVLLVPLFSNLKSRLSTDLGTVVAGIKMDIPIVSSPMDTVTESQMSIDLASLGGIGIVHRFASTENQILSLRRIARLSSAPIIPAIGVGRNEVERFKKIVLAIKPHAISAVAIDIANGHSILAKEMIDAVNDITGGSTPIIVGNIATYDGFCYLAELGVSAIRVGIGGGSICKTRIMTGCGIPTLTSIALARKAKLDNPLYKDVSIIADGGIRYPSDMVKSIVAGADAVMCGKILAGTDASPGEVVSVDGRSFKLYRGMASSEAQVARGTGLKSGTCAEGVSTYITYVGPLSGVIEEFSGGLRSAMTYLGVSNIKELQRNASFIIISGASMDESHAFGTKQ